MTTITKQDLKDAAETAGRKLAEALTTPPAISMPTFV